MHKPGDRWGCQCGLEATDEPATATPTGGAADRPALGLENNPAHDGKLIGTGHPYYPTSCATCPFSDGQKTSGTPTNKVNDCTKCQYLQDCLPDKITGNCFEKVGTKGGELRKHSLHGENETDENIMIASYLTNRYNHNIDLLPRREGKTSADAYNKTLKIYQEYKKPISSSKTAIDNALRDANRQAEAVVLFIDTDIDEDTLTRGIKGRIQRCTRLLSVTIIKDNKDVTYTKEALLSKEWKAKWTDLK